MVDFIGDGPLLVKFVSACVMVCDGCYFTTAAYMTSPQWTNPEKLPSCRERQAVAQLGGGPPTSQPEFCLSVSGCRSIRSTSPDSLDLAGFAASISIC